MRHRREGFFHLDGPFPRPGRIERPVTRLWRFLAVCLRDELILSPTVHPIYTIFSA